MERHDAVAELAVLGSTVAASRVDNDRRIREIVQLDQVTTQRTRRQSQEHVVHRHAGPPADLTHPIKLKAQPRVHAIGGCRARTGEPRGASPPGRRVAGQRSARCVHPGTSGESQWLLDSEAGFGSGPPLVGWQRPASWTMAGRRRLLVTQPAQQRLEADAIGYRVVRREQHGAAARPG